MSEYLTKKINYVVVCVNEFAAKKSIDEKTSFEYLDENGGIEFLDENYDIEHTLSLEDAVEDMELICRKHGGRL